MILFLVIITIILAFFIGLSVGGKCHSKTSKTKTEPSENKIRLQNDYENFLSYDGSVQI